MKKPQFVTQNERGRAESGSTKTGASGATTDDALRIIAVFGFKEPFAAAGWYRAGGIKNLVPLRGQH
jgi:hypothetical protein